MKTCKISFGKGEFELFLPNKNQSIHLLEPPNVFIPISWQKEYFEQINTILPKILDFKSIKVVIVTPDHTRACPTKELLLPILRFIEKRTIDYNIIVGTGTHRACTHIEKTSIIPLKADNKTIIHNCRDKNSLVEIGKIDNQPVLLNKAYVQADKRITISLIEPHFMAGFSGGPKALIPGIAAWETIAYSHSPQLLSHKSAKIGVLLDNPMHSFISRAANLCSPHLSVGVVIDRYKNPIKTFLGTMENVLICGANFYLRKLSTKTSQSFKTIVTCGGGYPLDATFYQAIKGLVSVADLAQPGARIYLFMEGSEGFGSVEFASYFKPPWTWEKIKRVYSENERVTQDQWQLQILQRYTNDKQIIICSNKLPNMHFGALTFVDIETGKKMLQMEIGKIAIVPRGPYTFLKSE